MLSSVRGRHSEARDHLDRFASWDKHVPIATRFIGIMYVFHRVPEEAARFALDYAPEFMGDDELEVTIDNVDATFLAAAVLYDQGRKERADQLCEQALALMRFMPRNRGESIQMRDIMIFVLRDEKDLAIEALRDAIHENWRSGSWLLRTPLFSTMNQEPEWRRLIAQLESEMDEDVKWYHEHKNDPLF